jgi:anti-sigma regulatory factor (Ser/Thr protein kinase)
MQVTGEALHVEGDRVRLVQVFANILANAAKYTPAGGQIHLELAIDASHAKVRVRDNGVGMSESLLPHLFDIFTQAERTPDRSQGGLGLGLSLVKNLVGLLGGTVTARSDGPGRGSEFTVLLPLLVGKPAPPVPPSPLPHVWVTRRSCTSWWSMTMWMPRPPSRCCWRWMATRFQSFTRPKMHWRSHGLPR